MGTNPQPAWQPLAIEAGAPLLKRPTASEAREMQGRDPVNRLDAIAARLEATTPGPWSRDDDGDVIAPGPACIVTTEGCGWGNDADAELIANAPADLAALLDAVRAVEILVEIAPHHGPFTAHEYTRRLRAMLAPLTEGGAS